MITRQMIADYINNYLTHKITKKEIIDWAEKAIMDKEYEESYFNQISNALRKIGVSDVNNFDLVWEDYVDILKSLDYKITVDISKVS